MVATEKKRRTFLTIWLVLMLIANIYAALTYLLLNSSIASAYPNVSSRIFYIFSLLGLANLVFVIFLFRWKRWAFYAFCGTTLVGFIMNLAIGLGIAAAIFGLIGPMILYAIMSPQWDLFK